nr:uncharacterized protein LOC128697179 [Cherax quadricarinatus]
MAILNSCCCWRSVRRGSYACAVYSMVYYLVLATSLWKFPQNQWTPDTTPDSVILADNHNHHHLPVIGQMGVAMLCLAILGLMTCVLLFIGLCKDVKVLLLPWLVDAVLVILLDVVFVAYIVYQEHLNLNPVVAITFTVDFFFLVLHTYALLCVTSQYQEYLEGRGTAMDERNRSPPIIRYTRQSTMNSGVESTRRTVTFLDHGGALYINGYTPGREHYPAPPSRSPSPSTISKECGSRCEDLIRSPNYLSPGDPLLSHKPARNNKPHVQFITRNNEAEMEKTEVTNDTLQATSPNSENPNVSLSCDQMPTSITISREVPSLPCISTSRGPEATPLIEPVSLEEVNRY